MFNFISVSVYSSEIESNIYNVEKSIAPVSSSNVNNLTYHNENLYFTASGVFDSKFCEQCLWKFDPSSDSHELLGPLKNNVSQLSSLGDKLFYISSEISEKHELTISLFYYDLTLKASKFITSFEGYSRAKLFEEHNGKLFLLIGKGNYVKDYSDALLEVNTEDNTKRKISELHNIYSQGHILKHQNNLYFSTKNSENKAELKRLNLENNSVSIILTSAFENSYFTTSTAHNNYLFYVESLNEESNSNQFNNHLKRLNILTNEKLTLGETNIKNVVKHNNILYFAGDQGSDNIGTELKSYDINKNELKLLADINTDFNDREFGYSGSNPSYLTVFKNNLFFWATACNSCKMTLWKYSIEENSILQINNFIGFEYNDLTDMITLEDKIYLKYAKPNNEYAEWFFNIELFSFEEPFLQPEIALDIYQRDRSSNPANFIVLDQELYFDAYSGEFGENKLLMKVTENGNVHTVTDSLALGLDFFSVVTALDKDLIISARQNGKTMLWRYNVETEIVNSLESQYELGYYNATSSNHAVFQNSFYFASTEHSEGQSLYNYNQSTNSIERLVKIPTSHNNGQINNLTVYKNELYFTAYDQSGKHSLWRYDQATKEALSVVNVDSLVEGSQLNNLTVHMDKLYFTTTSPINSSFSYHKMWSYDASSNNTREIESGNSTSIGGLITYKDKLYFTTHSPITEDESADIAISLWAYEQTSYEPVIVHSFTDKLVTSPVVVESQLVFTTDKGLTVYNGEYEDISYIDGQYCANLVFIGSMICSRNFYLDNIDIGVELLITKLKAEPARISGVPSTAVFENELYEFTPYIEQYSNENLKFSIKNKPAWANFDSTNGTLSGSPTASDIGVFSNILISVSNGVYRTQLEAFEIKVNEQPKPPVKKPNPESEKSSGGSMNLLLFLFTVILLFKVIAQFNPIAKILKQ